MRCHLPKVSKVSYLTLNETKETIVEIVFLSGRTVCDSKYYLFKKNAYAKFPKEQLDWKSMLCSNRALARQHTMNIMGTVSYIYTASRIAFLLHVDLNYTIK